MEKILWKRGEIAPQEQFHLFSTIFCNLILDLFVKTRTRFSLGDKQVFEITEAEITRVDCTLIFFVYNRRESLHFSTKHIGIFQILMFEILTKR